MKLFVVVVTYNSGHEWLDKCLGSLRGCSLPMQTIVIDNASADDSAAYIRANYPEVELIVSHENLGFAKANNLGIRKALAAGAEHVFLLNHDAWVIKDCLEQLVHLQQQSPEFGILSPIHLNGTGDLLDWNFTQYISGCLDDGRKLYSQLLKGEPLQAIYTTNFVNAAAWLMSRACIEQVGLFDTELFVHYGEDSHYAQRVRFHQFHLGVAPRCFIQHDREDRSGKALKTGFNQSAELLNFVLESSNLLQKDYQHLIGYHLRISIQQMLVALIKFDFRLLQQQLKLYRQKQQLVPIIHNRRVVNSKTAVWQAEPAD
jgi:GT2 family glycosyltransferase